ncbi:MAG: type II toxin-antitoxin system ParD family antitoxin [Alphaproteobacteria bacterium]|jgi:antitoxin ParD1/3/4|nr:type II toxin-antitoxin system ParD family antitoxin [Alphaproteobacteria bacterium]
MARITISLPEQLSRFVEARLVEGPYRDESDYLCRLIREDQARHQDAIAALRSLLDEAEASGISDSSPEEILEAARTEARQRGLLE